eukprot:365951-Chlamydomonas_euryale.AAC.3
MGKRGRAGQAGEEEGGNTGMCSSHSRCLSRGDGRRQWRREEVMTGGGSHDNGGRREGGVKRGEVGWREEGGMGFPGLHPSFHNRVPGGSKGGGGAGRGRQMECGRRQRMTTGRLGASKGGAQECGNKVWQVEGGVRRGYRFYVLLP